MLIFIFLLPGNYQKGHNVKKIFAQTIFLDKGQCQQKGPLVNGLGMRHPAVQDR